MTARITFMLNQAVKLSALLGGLALLLIVAVTFFNMIGLLWGLEGILGYEDIVTLFISTAMLFLPYAAMKDAHIKLDISKKIIPDKVAYYLDIIWNIVTLFLVLFLTYSLVLGMIDSYNDNVRARILGWSEWAFFLPGIFGLMLWCLVLLSKITSKNLK